MNDATNDRKIRHIRTIEADRETDRRKYYFDDIRLKHRALPELDLKLVDPSVTFMEKRLSFPLLISSMTGGDHELVRKINRNLALAAEETGVAMGVGSQRVMFSHPMSRGSFDLRTYAPNALLLSNLGAVQLNYGFTIEMCKEALKVVGADALILHLNPLQEAVQPDGNTDFSELAAKISHIAQRLEKPVVLKEVGAGMSEEDVRLVVEGGIRYLDVAGAGGLSWSRIEHHSLMDAERDDLGLTFQDWGIPTPQALMALKPYRDRVTLIASGGIRSGIDMVKALILGASLCGLASPFLKPAMESAELVIEAIQRLRREFVTTMFLLGVGTAEQLVGNEGLLLK
ncbi:MAG: type 2 isopentenyl-diphosphate Delta-isomerase [Verrucomicrobia bacterium A1]|nr:MAG: type 2 isopentenyl-diphosphate Delta-isomerase [Verrucomicrobia bacterium A1]